MLTRYSDLKEAIKDTDRQIKSKRREANDKHSLITNLKVKVAQDKDLLDEKIRSGVEGILNGKIQECRSVFEYEKQILKQFKTNHMEKLGYLSGQLQSDENIDSTEYKESFNRLIKLQGNVRETLAKFVPDSDLKYYSGLGYGLDVSGGNLVETVKQIDYLYDFDNYNNLITSAVSLDTHIEKIEVSTVIYVSVGIFVVLCALKYVVLLPLIVYIICCLYMRIGYYIRILELTDVYGLIESLVDDSIGQYDKSVAEVLSDSLDGISRSKAYVEQICERINTEIDKQMSEEIKNIRMNFNREEAREQAMKELQTSDDHLADTIKEEEEAYEQMTAELMELVNQLREQQEDLKKLKDDINKVYQKLEPSFSEKIILKEFFLGFDSSEEPVTFKYGGKSTLILYNGSDREQLDYVMATIKMMCGQIMCSMYPLAYTIDVVDCYTSGTLLAPFQVKSDSGESEGDTDLFKVTTTTTGTKRLVKSMYEEFTKRRVNVLGSFENIEAMNKQKISFDARTIPYLVTFFYNFDYTIFKEDEMIQQLCRVSGNVGIVPIVFMDMSSFGESDKEKGIEYKYPSELILDVVELFDNNIYGFNIAEDSVDIMKFDIAKLKEHFRR